MATNETKRFAKILAATTLAMISLLEFPPWIFNKIIDYRISKIDIGMDRKTALRILGLEGETSEEVHLSRAASLLRRIQFQDITRTAPSVRFANDKVESISHGGIMINCR